MTSRIGSIAREDFRQALRDRLLWGAFALVFLLMVPTFWHSLGGGAHTIREKIAYIPYDFRMYVVILVVVISYNAVVGERERGTLRLLLGLPGTRFDVVVGKLVSRVTLVVLTLLPILFVLDILLAIRFDSFFLATYVPIACWIVLYAVLWTSFTIGVSTAFSSQYRTLAVLASTYLFFSSLVDIWNTFVLPVFAFLFTGSFSTDSYHSLGTGTEPLWVSYTGRANPVSAFVVGGEWVASLFDPTTPVTYVLPNLFGIMILVFFGVVPLLIGYLNFQHTDLS